MTNATLTPEVSRLIEQYSERLRIGDGGWQAADPGDRDAAATALFLTGRMRGPDVTVTPDAARCAERSRVPLLKIVPSWLSMLMDDLKHEVKTQDQLLAEQAHKHAGAILRFNNTYQPRPFVDSLGSYGDPIRDKAAEMTEELQGLLAARALLAAYEQYQREGGE